MIQTMRRMSLLWMIPLWAVLAEGSPLLQINSRDITTGIAGTGTLGRLVYGIISMISLFGLAFALGLRVTQFEKKKKLQFMWILCQVQTVLALGLVVSGAILVYGLNLTTYKQCRASITVCLFLYFSSKIFLYIFYLERVHLVRSPDVFKRRHDKIWVIGMITVVGFFGGMALWAIATPHARIDIKDGHCRIGSDMVPSYTTFSSDIIINIALTGVFCWLIFPMLLNDARNPSQCGTEASRPERIDRKPSVVRGLLTRKSARNDQLSLSVKKMLKRNIIGSALTFFAGAINLVIYFVDATSQIAYVCFTLCIVDVVFGVLVVQWLTFGSTKSDANTIRSTTNTAATCMEARFTSLSMPEPVMTPLKSSR
ncbi:unnamed protein product [Periconia digitata]|uniref:Uncharacterized protein n=1 Tax=Periconia digitata TaxID=1303443 RepID=A0A9W4XFN0_9PLEO|nr:unnamed protein product [Periconia digitata]